MYQEFINFILNIPQTCAQFSNWITSPINPDIELLNISPLGLFGIGGVTIVIGLITLHAVRLVTP